MENKITNGENIMKKISMFALCALMPICSAMAGSNSQNMVHQTAPVYWSVTEVVDMPDDTPVVLVGRITKNMGNEMFVFEDASGTIMLEIDEEDWNGNTVRVDDIVTVYGHVDKKGNITEIEVDSIVK
jgi:uncharacterized protein (TIGR00156 family)